jgi:leucyl-tRNA synthetase
MHLLYARFYSKVLRDFGVLSVDEPFTNLLTQGMVCKESMKCATHGFLFPEEVEEGNCIHCKQPVAIGKTEKMSKSLKNVVDPDYLIKEYGADTTRLFCLFAAPPEKDLEWSDQGVEGAFRFLNRTWRIIMDYLDSIKGIAPFEGSMALPEDLKNLRRKTHQTIKKVTGDIEDRFHFNTAISAVMELVNVLYQVAKPADNNRTALAVIRETIESIVLLLAPIVPHVAEELWTDIGKTDSLADAPWPSYDPAIAAEEEITIVIQINGKLRSRINVPAEEEAEKIKDLAMADEKIVKMVEGKQVVKVVYVPKKLVNIVVKE